MILFRQKRWISCVRAARNRLCDLPLYDGQNNLPKSVKYSRSGRTVGAIRLPNNAFQANAGTEVVSDIIFHQSVTTHDIEPDWVHLGEK